MAKGGGGAWKVAYADFVTAMMAFFMVMWICGQDQKIKQSIAHYFNNPLGINPLGESSVPDKRGNIFRTPNNGKVPAADSIQLGMGRMSFSANHEPSTATRFVSDYLTSDDERVEKWKAIAHNEREVARIATSGNLAAIEKAAVIRLSQKMRLQFENDIPRSIPDVYRDLLFQSSHEINWDELAEDVISR